MAGPADTGLIIVKGETVTGGIFDGFEGLMPMHDAQCKELLTSGLVIPDANVLLNLYRYNANTRGDLFSVFHQVAPQLWCPHRVVEEFWRNRADALSDPKRAHQHTVDRLGEALEAQKQALRTWRNRLALDSQAVEELENLLSGTFEQVAQKLDGARQGPGGNRTHKASRWKSW